MEKAAHRTLVRVIEDGGDQQTDRDRLRELEAERAAIEANLAAMAAPDALEEARQRHGLPRTIRVDQGSQFTSKELDLWAYANSITLDFSRPGKPTDNAYVESFNASVRLECLGQHWFLDLDDARQKVEDWRREYNESSN